MHILYAATAPSAGGLPSYWIAIYVLFFAAIWYFMIRPQSNRQKKHQELVKNLKRGDRVITSGGLHGVVVDVREDVLRVRVAAKTDVTVSRSSVQAVTGKISKEDQRRQEREKPAVEELPTDDIVAEGAEGEEEGTKAQT